MSEFSDRPFVAGSLVGLRAFDVDTLGRLRAPSFDFIFKPGENVAACQKQQSVGGMRLTLPPPVFYASPSYSFDPTTNEVTVEFTSDPAPRKPEKPAKRIDTPAHEVGNLTCACGFYAYMDGRNDYKQRGRVAGVVEGYGTCTVGTRGFRAAKVRVAALIKPGPKFHADGRWDRLVSNYPDVPVFANKAAALAEFPLTAPEWPTPETTEDFWTREASR